MVCAGSALAHPGYTRRPKGWFIIAPPLTKPDPANGKRYVDKAAPEKRWFAMVIHGSDGHYYDFADKNSCDEWKNSAIVELSKLPKTLPLLWVGRSKCVKDDNRRTFITYDRWQQLMEKYQDNRPTP